MKKMQKALHYPDQNFSSLHVAGTNGKGSVSLKIAKVLQKMGYKVGLFTSPHISSFRERIRINDTKISEEEMVFFSEKCQALAKKLKLPLSFFEELTLLALLYFQEKEVDFVVWEVGLGGRLDATNIITPCLSIITSIGWDHMKLLGNSLEQIAEEKAGIIKPYTPVVLGPTARKESILRKAEQLQAPVFFVEQKASFFDEENQAIAKKALSYLFPKEKLEEIASTLLVRPPARFEVVYFQQNIIVLDTAHNRSAFAKLAEALFAFYPQEKVSFLLAFSKDKEVEPSLFPLFPLAKKFYFTTHAHPRLRTLEELRSSVGEIPYPTSWHTSLQEALAKALVENKILVIAGSFFILSEVRLFLGIQEEKDPF